MRLGRTLPPGPQFPVITLANLALLVTTCVIVASMASASRGPGLRFAGVDRDGSLGSGAVVRVEVTAQREASVSGTIVPFDRIAAEVAARLTDRPDAAVFLVVSPDASYETMLTAYAAIAALPGPPKIALPPPVRGERG
jgi:hypothetical protein